MPTTDLFEIDPRGIITINGEVIVMEETDANYKKYLLFLQNNGTVVSTETLAPFTPEPATNMKG
jgi:hypothetical protein